MFFDLRRRSWELQTKIYLVINSAVYDIKNKLAMLTLQNLGAFLCKQCLTYNPFPKETKPSLFCAAVASIPFGE